MTLEGMDYSLYDNYGDLGAALIDWLRLQFKTRGFTKAVLGLSGGLDSAVTARLISRALGPENIFAYFIPYRSSASLSREHSYLIADLCRISLSTEDITDVVDTFFIKQPEACRMRRGNLMARIRMCLLYDRSYALNALVAGSGNLTEISLGYGTLHGDCAWSMSPLATLLKTHVRALAADIGIPPEIIDKAPTADLWEGQTDEEELQFSYQQADLVLQNWLYRGMQQKSPAPVPMLPSTDPVQGVPDETVRRIYGMYNRNSFKREPQAAPNIYISPYSCRL